MEEMEGGGEAPHGVLLAAVVGVVVVGPFVVGDYGQAIVEAIPELLGPAGFLFFPLTLVLLIRLLSSDRSKFLYELFSTGSPDSIHRVGGSPVGIALALLLIAVLLYYRTSLFGNDHGD